MAQELPAFRSRQEGPVETDCWPALSGVELGSQARAPESAPFAPSHLFIRPEKVILPEGVVTPATSTSQPLPNSLVGTNTSDRTQEVMLNVEGLVRGVIVKVPRLAPPRTRSEILQQWEGEVRTVDADEFTAVIRDLGSAHAPEEEVTLAREEVSDGDLQLVQPGAIFYWAVGYRISPGGQKTRTSELLFRRLPAWSRRQLERARERAREFERVLGIR